MVIIGAGIAGIAAASELLTSAHRVTLLEAGTRPGGRAATIRELFADGLYVDTGGFRFAAEHFHVRRLLASFGLEYVPFFPHTGQSLLYLNGRLIRRRPAERIKTHWLPRPLSTEETWVLDQETEWHFFRVRGGVDKIVEGFAAHTNSVFSPHCEVKRVVQTPTDVIVTYTRDGNTEEIRADHVICAVPTTILAGIDFNPSLPPDKLSMISNLSYRPAALMYFQMPSEYWTEQKLSGYAVTDTVGEIWTPGLYEFGDKCITIVYAKDDGARQLLALSHDERAAVTMERCEKFLPWFRDFVMERVAFSWDEDRLLGGSFSTACFLSRGELQILKRPEGRLHFAGEHVADRWPGWMEGALESAGRVVAEINQSI